MSLVRALHQRLVNEIELHELRAALAGVAHELGGDVNDPRTVVWAAQGLRDALNRLRGYQGTPCDADGRSVAYNVVGR
jgi:hypothetical protein